jgi:antitoxin component of RelBE/YafQ-DinJ toxin-antitoxin module
MGNRRWLYMAREEKIMVRIKEEVKNEFQKKANEYGLTMSALAAYIIGQWVYQQRMMDPLYSQLGDKIGELIRRQIEASK